MLVRALMLVLPLQLKGTCHWTFGQDASGRHTPTMAASPCVRHARFAATASRRPAGRWQQSEGCVEAVTLSLTLGGRKTGSANVDAGHGAGRPDKRRSTNAVSMGDR